MALAEMQYPGWLGRLLTHPVRGLQNYAETMRLLTEEKSAIKVFVELDSFMVGPFWCVVGNIWPRSDEHGCAGRGRA